MICEVCGKTIIFYAHQRYDGARMMFTHPECCVGCPERHQVRDR